MHFVHLSIEGIIVDKVSAVEFLIMCLVHGDHIFFSLEYFNLL